MAVSDEFLILFDEDLVVSESVGELALGVGSVVISVESSSVSVLDDVDCFGSSRGCDPRPWKVESVVVSVGTEGDRLSGGMYGEEDVVLFYEVYTSRVRQQSDFDGDLDRLGDVFDGEEG